MRGFFVVGTDAGVGKTCVALGLVHLLVSRGWRTAALKPVACGQQFRAGHWVHPDVELLQFAGNVALTAAQTGPLQLHTPCEPQVAATLEGIPVDRASLLHSLRQTAGQADAVVMEGASGLRVPLLPDWDTADLACDLGLPLVLVVGLRPGCISHALLSAEAIARRDLPLAGWVANTLHGALDYPAQHLSLLQEALQAPCWGHLPRLLPALGCSVAAHLQHALVLQALSCPKLQNQRPA